MRAGKKESPRALAGRAAGTLPLLITLLPLRSQQCRSLRGQDTTLVMSWDASEMRAVFRPDGAVLNK